MCDGSCKDFKEEKAEEEKRAEEKNKEEKNDWKKPVKIAFGVLIVFMLYPIILFLFYLLDIGASLKRKVLEKDEMGLVSLLKIKHILSWLISALLALLILDVNLDSLSLFSGLLAAGLSVAMRDTIGNFIAGMQMLWDRTLKVGDVVSIPRSMSEDTGSTYGVVKEIKGRYTIIEDRNTVRRLVPNSLIISSAIEHWTHEDKSVRLSLQIGIPYIESCNKIRKAKQIMESVCYEVPRVLATKPPNALLVGYGASELRFSLRFWIDDAQAGIRPVISEVLLTLYDRLQAEGIEIPFSQHDVHIKDINLKEIQVKINNKDDNYENNHSINSRVKEENDE